MHRGAASAGAPGRYEAAQLPACLGAEALVVDAQATGEPDHATQHRIDEAGLNSSWRALVYCVAAGWTPFSRKFTAIIDIARTPTTRAFSSTKNFGLWFGAALAGSCPSGVTPRNT